MQDLQTDTQTFEALREGKFLYVDKTRQIFDLISKGRAYFLSRPRRFGKSLLVSTFEALFKNKKDLFKDLYIYDKWEWGTAYPVIKIDFSNRTVKTMEILENTLSSLMLSIAAENGITLFEQYTAEKFAELIKKLYEKKRQKVVILIDEYDKAIRDNLDLPLDKQNEIRKALRNFYEVMKGNDEYIRFIFLTGVTKFSGLVIFSGLNNLKDITLDPRFCDICGYTQDELENHFKEYIDELTKIKGYDDRQKTLREIKDWYNGYTWDGKTAIYNPYSTLNLFADMEFNNYWFDSASPSFLIEYLQKHGGLDMPFEKIRVVQEELMSGDEYTKNLKIALLFQAGYLTIKEVSSEGRQYAFLPGRSVDRKIFTLGLPNLEVGISLADVILIRRLEVGFTSDAVLSLTDDFVNSIEKIDEKLFTKALGDLLECVPYQIAGKNESHYHSNILLALKMMGFNVEAENSTGRGRIDIVLRYGNTIVLIETKYTNKIDEIDAKMKQAFEQIDDRQYYRKFEHEGKQIILVGIVFANEVVKQKDNKEAKVKFKVEFRVRELQ